VVLYAMPYKDPERQREWHREWFDRVVKKRRAKWLKENGPCTKCGSQVKLEVDHTDPKRKIDHRVWTWAEERRDAELKKCQVLCSRCHKGKTSKARKLESYKHGRERMYRALRCRCSKCRAWKSSVNAQRKLKEWR
jgi:hypothetical protein